MDGMFFPRREFQAPRDLRAERRAALLVTVRMTALVSFAVVLLALLAVGLASLDPCELHEAFRYAG